MLKCIEIRILMLFQIQNTLDMKYSLFLFGLLACSIQSKISSRGADYRQHLESDQCCLENKGKLCGKAIKSCCKADKGCDSRWYGDFCVEDLSVSCETTCSSMCTNAGGKACGASVSSGAITCCSPENCIQPKQGTLSNKLIDKALNSLVNGLTKVGVKHQGSLDKIFDKFLGPQPTCNSKIDIPKSCVADSYFNLISTRIFGQ